MPPEGYEAVEPLLKQSWNDGRIRLSSRRSYFEDFRGRSFRDADLAALFHENSKMSRVPRTRAELAGDDIFVGEREDFFQRSDHDYLGRELVELPDCEPPEGALADALRDRRTVRRYSGAPVTLEQLSTLLRYACGRPRDDAASGEGPPRRSYPSAGALYPVEVYPIVLGCRGVEPGFYYYSTARHGLRSLPVEEDPEAVVDEVVFTEDVDADRASVVLALTGAFARTKSKYGPRGYRFALQEAGHVGQNVQLTATAMDLGCAPVGGTHDRSLEERLGVDGHHESLAYTLAVGVPRGE
jgi:SagB-type dehydrogenase family enzyme